MKRHTTQGVRKAEKDMSAAKALAAQTSPPRNAACFHCQQTVEKYLKALLQEVGAAELRTHDIEDFLDLLLPHDATWAPLRWSAASLTKYAIEFHHPGVSASTRQMRSAV